MILSEPNVDITTLPAASIMLTISPDGATDGVDVGVGVEVLVGVFVGVPVCVDVFVGVTVIVCVGVLVGVSVIVGVGVGVTLNVDVEVGVGVGVMNTQVFQYPLFVNQVDASLPLVNVVPEDNDSANNINDSSVNNDLPNAIPAGIYKGFGWLRGGIGFATI